MKISIPQDSKGQEETNCEAETYYRDYVDGEGFPIVKPDTVVSIEDGITGIKTDVNVAVRKGQLIHVSNWMGDVVIIKMLSGDTYVVTKKV